MWHLNTGDCLIEVTTWADLTVQTCSMSITQHIDPNYTTFSCILNEHQRNVVFDLVRRFISIFESVPITLPWLGVLDSTLSDRVCHWLAENSWFSIRVFQLYPTTKLTAMLKQKYRFNVTRSESNKIQYKQIERLMLLTHIYMTTHYPVLVQALP